MEYVSTRGRAPEADFADALLRGLAPDGGLYLPRTWPQLDADWFRAAAGRPYADITREVLDLYLAGSLGPDASTRAVERLTHTFLHEAVTPLVQLEPNLWLLELFHGPTAAFKDLAMQMMAPLSDAALAKADERLLLLTATSGDTGAAAVRAFAGAERVSLAVLHPEGRVSPVQRRQMTTTVADNVLNLAVRGDFDDCQRLVKALLSDESLRAKSRVSSVNSINWGRLVGQIPYYIASAVAVGAPDRAPRFVVPTGNFGDAFAGLAAKRMGLPMGRMTAAVNSNDALARAINDGLYQRTRAVHTASVSMDVQAPSNFERLVFEAFGRDSDANRAFFETFAAEGEATLSENLLVGVREEVDAVSIDEAETQAEIQHAWKAYGRVICPHTAVAVAAARRLDRSEGPVIALSTAHAAKFPDSVEAALGFPPIEPAQIRAIEDRPERFTVIDADVNAARAAVAALQG